MSLLDIKSEMTLDDRIHALSPELFNRVLYHFLDVDQDERVYLEPTHKQPVQLQLCKSIRQEYAKKYYKRPFNFAFLDEVLMYRWRNSGPREYTQHVERSGGSRYWMWVKYKEARDEILGRRSN